MYKAIREILFQFPTEDVHYFSMGTLKKLCLSGAVRHAISSHFTYHHPSLQRNIFGLPFKNPVGLGAGFDKNALYLKELETLGFGFVEIGTVTPKPQAGNDKPRLFRLPADKAIINRMGFNNEGVEVVKKRLGEWKNQQAQTSSPALVIGGNIGKNKATPNDDAWKDYEFCFRELFGFADYFVVNVSSPNTPGLRELQEKGVLLKILSTLQNTNQGQSRPKPLLLKIAPDLTKEQLDDIVGLAFETQLSGLVATNTTIGRENLVTDGAKITSIGAGGLSGKPLKEMSTHVVKYLAQQTQNKVPIIASGGIFTAADAKEKLAAGAGLVQVWTGFIYEGPGIAKNICRGLVQ